MSSGKNLGKKVVNKGIDKMAQKLGVEKFVEEIRNSDNRNRHSYYFPKPDPDNIEAAHVTPAVPVQPKQPSPGHGYDHGHRQGPVASSNVTDFHRSQNYDSLRRQLLSSNSLFRDDKFPADNSLLTDNHGGVVSYWGRNRMNGSEIEWLRPAV